MNSGKIGTGKYPPAFFFSPKKGKKKKEKLPTQHGRVRRGREIMKVILFFRMNFHSPCIFKPLAFVLDFKREDHQKTSPQVNSKLKK